MEAESQGFLFDEAEKANTMGDSQRVVTDRDEKTRTHSDSKGTGGESFHRETCQIVQRPTRIRKGDLDSRR